MSITYELFEKGELDYLVGKAYYYRTLVRGLDLPEKVSLRSSTVIQLSELGLMISIT